MVWALELLGFWGLVGIAIVAPMIAALFLMAKEPDEETALGWGAGIVFIFALGFALILWTALRPGF